MPPTPVSHTIGAVAEATGVSVDMLRTWESRHGFPAPDRHAGGHRRYSDADVLQIQEVLVARAAGLSLEAAIARARTNVERQDTSIFAGIRRRWPDQPVQLLSKRALTAISRAIEDECCAQAERPILVGCFQREVNYRRSERRWRELSRTARWAVVFADFPVTTHPRSGPDEVAVPGDEPLLREWVVICDSPRASACVAAVERIGANVPEDRRFETIWSVDPRVVRGAVHIAAALAGSLRGAAEILADPVPDTDVTASLANATALLSRTIAYLEAAPAVAATVDH